MSNILAKLSEYVNWLLITAALTSLTLSILSFLLVLSTRKRVRGFETMMREMAEAVNRLSTDAHTAMDAASNAAKAALESAKAAKESAVASKDCVGNINRVAESLVDRSTHEGRMLGEGRE
jgi:methyl-accepting chemotaxis protein